MRLVILNALVPPPDRGVVAITAPTKLSRCYSAARFAALCADEKYVGHGATAELLGIAPSRGTYVPQIGDVAVVVTLAHRLSQPGDVSQLTYDDVLVRVAYYAAAGCPCGDSGCLGDTVRAGKMAARVHASTAEEVLRVMLSDESPSAGCLYA